MTKITTYNRGIIIDGHADTKEECETITLLCNSLAKDKNFKQVAYDKGYAAFERVGHTEELRFALLIEGDITVNFDTGIESVDFKHGSATNTFTTSGESYNFFTEPGNDITLTINLKSGYSLKSSSLGNVSGNIVTIPFSTVTSPTEMACTLVSEVATVKKSVDLTTLSGWANLSSGNHTIKIKAKGTGYRESELSAGVVVSKAGANPNVVSTTGLQSNQTLVASTNENLLTNSLVKSFYNNYKSKSLSELLQGIQADLTEEHTIDGVAVKYSEYDKLSEDCSIFVIKEGDNYYFETTGPLGETIVLSPQLEGQTYEPAKIIFGIVSAQTGLFFALPCKNITGQQGTVETLDDIGVAFLAVRTKVTLEEGTYKWKDNVTLIDIDQDIEFTSNNTQYTIIKSNEGRAVITYTTSYMAAVYNNGAWTNEAYKTITLSTDQQVSQEFYTWFTANANKVYTLEAGTYKFVNSPTSPDADLQETAIENVKGYYLTANNVYATETKNVYQIDVQTTDTGLASLTIYIDVTAGVTTYNLFDGETENPSWHTNDFTATDTTKLKILVVEQNIAVSPEFYKWAITDGNLVKQAAGETWVLNDSDALTESNQDFTSLNFTSDSQSFVRILRQYNNSPIPPVNSLLYYKSDGTYVTAVYTNDDGIAFWNRQAYRTLTFATPPTGDLLTWLQANGTKQTGYNLTINYSTVPMSTGAAYIKINSDTVSSSNYDYVVQPGTSSTNPTLKNSAGTTLTVPYVVPNVEKVAFMGGLAIAVNGSTNNTSPYTLTADTTISPGVYGPTADTPIAEPTI